MRLWHYDLIDVLPQKQLVAQWRELLAIKGAIEKNGTPNHRLVNKIMDYRIYVLTSYAESVIEEMRKRGYKPNNSKVIDMLNWESDLFGNKTLSDFKANWHNDRYFMQCYYNLQEKYDCDILTDDEWLKIEQRWCSWNDFI